MDDDNTLYVADYSNHRIVVTRPNSTTVVRIIGNGSGSTSTQLKEPTDVFVTSTAIFILDASNYRVQRYPRNGAQVTTVAGSTAVSGGSASLTTFGISYSLFVDILDFLYVSDYYNHRVLRFPPNSSYETSAVIVAGTGVSGSGPAMLNYAWGIFVDDDLILYVADTSNHRIQQWGRNACSRLTVAGALNSGTSLSQLNSPVAVVVDANNYMYITDQSNNRILRWLIGACAGECIASCSDTNAGTAADRFSSPRDIAFDRQGSLYVSDGYNDRVQRFLLSPTTGQ